MSLAGLGSLAGGLFQGYNQEQDEMLKQLAQRNQQLSDAAGWKALSGGFAPGSNTGFGPSAQGGGAPSGQGGIGGDYAASGAPSGGPLLATAKAESDMRNIYSNVDPDVAGPNTRSQGFLQINVPTWSDFAPAEVKAKWPHPMQAPIGVQFQVASNIPISRFGERTQRILFAQFPWLDKHMTLGQAQQRWVAMKGGQEPGGAVMGREAGGPGAAAMVPPGSQQQPQQQNMPGPNVQQAQMGGGQPGAMPGQVPLPPPRPPGLGQPQGAQPQGAQPQQAQNPAVQTLIRAGWRPPPQQQAQPQGAPVQPGGALQRAQMGQPQQGQPQTSTSAQPGQPIPQGGPAPGQEVSLQSVIERLKSMNLPPAVAFKALQEIYPILDKQSKMDMQQIMLGIREQNLNLREASQGEKDRHDEATENLGQQKLQFDQTRTEAAQSEKNRHDEATEKLGQDKLQFAQQRFASLKEQHEKDQENLDRRLNERLSQSDRQHLLDNKIKLERSYLSTLQAQIQAAGAAGPDPVQKAQIDKEIKDTQDTIADLSAEVIKAQSTRDQAPAMGGNTSGTGTDKGPQQGGGRVPITDQRGAPQNPLDKMEGRTPGGGQLPTIKTPAESRKLPPGTHYLTPDGVEYVVPGG